jgi:hypothetical protein
MCDGTELPHWGHLLRCGACQRFAALRMRNRILDVLRFGTPIFREPTPKQKKTKRQQSSGFQITRFVFLNPET